MGFLRPACAFLLLAFLCLGGLAGCSAEGQDDAASGASSAAVEEGQEEHEAVALRVAAPVAMQGVLEELASSYAADKDWLSFDFSYYRSAKKENAALEPTEEAGSSDDADDSGANPVEAIIGGGADDASSSGSSAIADSSSAADGDDAVLLPEAEIVFQNSLSAMDAAEEEGAADPATRADMLQDRLVIVISDESDINAVSTADIEAGAVPLAVVEGGGAHAKRQFQALEGIGVYEDGDFTGYYAKAKDAVASYDSTASLFEALGADDERAAIVRTSDLYRYGGVKVVGSVPARLYDAMWFPQALGMNVAAREDGDQLEQAARDFLSWMETDAGAQGIIEKWGFFPAA